MAPNKPKPLKGADKLLEEINHCCLVCVLRMSNLPCGAARPCLLHAAASACVFRIDKRVLRFLPGNVWKFFCQFGDSVFKYRYRGYSAIPLGNHRLTPLRALEGIQ